jgi:uncharacterized protein (TIGR02231 family)
LSKKVSFLDSLINFSQAQIPQDIKTSFPNVEDLERVLLFLDKNLQDINEIDEALDSKLEAIDKEIDKLERELASLKRPLQKTKKHIEIIFDSKREQEIMIEASYLVYGASWRLLYKMDVPLDLKEVNLIMFSKITQKTGEDWNDITLCISNAVPLKGAGLPSLNSWLLDIVKPGALREKTDFLFSKKVQLEEKEILHAATLAPERDAEFGYARRKKLPLSFEYTLPQILTIHSKDKETILPLFSKKIAGEFFLLRSPKS